LWKKVQGFLKKLKIKILHDLAMPQTTEGKLVSVKNFHTHVHSSIIHSNPSDYGQTNGDVKCGTAIQ
jgi:hypothetical protein